MQGIQSYLMVMFTNMLLLYLLSTCLYIKELATWQHFAGDFYDIRTSEETDRIILIGIFG